jgi:3-oxoacyl-[acyl-carrier protein] reductase
LKDPMSSESANIDELKSLTGEVVLVTGASRGIGQAIALALKAKGATVIGTATGQTGIDSIAQAGLVARQLDVTQASAAEVLVEEIAKTFGPISILVNNAGITRDTLAMRMRDEDWESVIQTNLSAVFRMSRLVMRGMMKARTGRIINITSVIASAGNAGQSNYAAAKAGVEGMTRALARELGSRNITVNSVAPGLIDTDMTKALNEQQVALMLAQIPLSRFGLPSEIAAAVVFLASKDAAYITGTTLHVNGGMYM